VGGGISGLDAAYFFREKAGTSARILILENHDDFGGHAKRNEFHLGGRLQLLNGGTFLIDSPTPYSRVADGLLKKLGIDPPDFDTKFTDHKLYRSLGLQSAVFFDRETFGQDRLVVGSPGRNWEDEAPENMAGKTISWGDFLSKTPPKRRTYGKHRRLPCSGKPHTGYWAISALRVYLYRNIR